MIIFRSNCDASVYVCMFATCLYVVLLTSWLLVLMCGLAVYVLSHLSFMVDSRGTQVGTIVGLQKFNSNYLMNAISLIKFTFSFK